MNDDEKRDETMIAEDHPQTRKAEPNARGSAAWNEDVVKPGTPTVEELAEQAEETRRKAVGDGAARDSLGSDKASGE